MQDKQNVFVKGNLITIYKMENQFCVSDFIRAMKKALRFISKNGFNEINIECLCAREHIFPDACVPISAIIQEYKSLYEVKINIAIKNNNYLENCYFSNPLNLSAPEIKVLKNPLNKIFSYESERDGSPQAAAIDQAFVDYMSRTVECEEGVLKGMMWCIYEVMDNVLMHSKAHKGYIMAQYHKSTNIIAICVYDCGIGIYNSLKLGGINPASELDSINLALQEGVSDGLGQGNGLYGLAQIVEANGGRLAISTGKSTLMLKKGGPKAWRGNPVISKEHRSTTVDFQLELANKTDIKEALRSIGDIEDFDIRIDKMVQEKSDWLIYKVSDYADDTGTRPSGKALRIDVMNIIRRTGQPIIIDFSDILICGSSFIDEFIAKLSIELGPVKFNQLIVLHNMNEELVHLCNRAIAMRINKEWNP